MADDGEPLGDYLDKLIYSQYVDVQRGIGYLIRSPLHSAVVEYIEDEKTGRPHPIDDSADHYLLRKFDIVRRDISELPLPVQDGIRGERRLPHRRWSDGYVGPGWIKWTEGQGGERIDGHYYANEMHGEIGWGCLHGDPDWPCTECGHHPNDHRDDDGGGPVTDDTMLTYCGHGNCSCGQRIGR
jgi:hypothetical protein